jgi:hypothetical protein
VDKKRHFNICVVVVVVVGVGVGVVAAAATQQPEKREGVRNSLSSFSCPSSPPF